MYLCDKEVRIYNYAYFSLTQCEMMCGVCSFIVMKISEEQEKPKARYVVLCRYRSLVSVASMQYWDIIVGGSLHYR